MGWRLDKLSKNPYNSDLPASPARLTFKTEPNEQRQLKHKRAKSYSSKVFETAQADLDTHQNFGKAKKSKSYLSSTFYISDPLRMKTILKDQLSSFDPERVNTIKKKITRGLRGIRLKNGSHSKKGLQADYARLENIFKERKNKLSLDKSELVGIGSNGQPKKFQDLITLERKKNRFRGKQLARQSSSKVLRLRTLVNEHRNQGEEENHPKTERIERQAEADLENQYNQKQLVAAE